MGRKRKKGQRTASGRLSRSKTAAAERSGLADTLEQPHRRTVDKSLRRDQRAENELGRLFLRGVLTEAECSAGEKYRRLMHDFSQVLATPMTGSSAMSAMVAPGIETPAEAEYLSCEVRETDEERRERVLAAHDGATRTIDRAILDRNTSIFDSTMAGFFHASYRRIEARDVWSVLDAVVIRDAQMPVRLMPHLCLALDALVARWRLDDDGVREMRGIADMTATWPHEERTLLISYKTA